MSHNLNQQLSEHTFHFAQSVREFGKVLPNTVSNVEDLKELIRSSGAVGSSYIAAAEATNKQDYLIRMKDSGKELKTAQYWLRLVDTQGDSLLEEKRKRLIHVSQELLNVFFKILHSSGVK
ncbi:MAG: four helix bundle protein [Bacteroidetes bacterium]|nr:four helix bundle protein [Bacteroidota bacterium]MCB0844436.1 four helix bundle protein [Bacteroidota bacterium]MCB0853184.1 four helix bundle protein [Bacteroidota bacterium]